MYALIPLGSYTGWQLADIPIAHLRWVLWGCRNGDQAVAAAVRDELRRRRMTEQQEAS